MKQGNKKNKNVNKNTNANIDLDINDIFVSKPNKDQLQAITTVDGPLLIIAGPGSGKSTTLINRIFYLLIEKKVSPENIFISTFTEKAANELLSKISDQLVKKNINIAIDKMYIGTMHSIFLDLLEEFKDYTDLEKHYRVLDQFDQQYLITKHIRDFRDIDKQHLIFEETKWWWRDAEKVMSIVNIFSEQVLDYEKKLKYVQEEEKDETIKVLFKIYEKYNEILKDENAIDFSKIQYVFLKMISENEQVLNKLRERFKYMMIDEYQDTNDIQERILFKLLNKEENICVVGDDDQSLYRFRGASVKNILEFKNHFKNCKQVNLFQNYRSHSGIIDFFTSFIKEYDWLDPDNQKKSYRFDKKIISGKDKKEELNYPSVISLSGKDEEEWHKTIISFLNFLKAKKIVTDWNQVVFLFRSVKSEKVKLLSEALEENNINVYTPRSNLFFERDEIRLSLGALFVILKHYINIEGIYDKHREFIIECIDIFNKELKKDKELKQFIGVKQFEINEMAEEEVLDYSFSNLFYQLFQFKFLSKYLNIKDDDIGNIFDTRQVRNLSILSNILIKFENLENISVFTERKIKSNVNTFVNNFLQYLFDGGIEEYEDEEIVVPTNCVSFMTIHQAKGLEFPVVFACSMNDKPSEQRNLELLQLLEKNGYISKSTEPIERMKYYDFYRLHYTAFSRAKNLLVLTSINKGSQINKYFKNCFNSLKSYDQLKKDKNMWDKLKQKQEDIKNKEIHKTYSYTTDILLYEGCPVQYKFFKELEFAPLKTGTFAYGALVHATIEDVHKAILKDRNIKITNEMVKDWFDKNYETIKKRDHIYIKENIRDVAIERVQKYVKLEKQTLNNIAESEYEIYLNNKTYNLKGKIDLIRNKDDKNKIDIIDFKAEEKPNINDHTKQKRLEQYKRQLEIYTYILEKDKNIKVENMYLYYVGAKDGENPYISFKNDNKSIQKTIDEVSNVVKKIENHDYRIYERDDYSRRQYCHNCNIRQFCDKCIKKYKGKK